MTDQVDVVGFDLDSFLAEAERSAGAGLYGEFQQGIVTPGFYSFANGVEWDKRFVPVEVGKTGAQQAAREAVLKMGDKFNIGYSLTLLKGTRINEDPAHVQDKDYTYVYKKSSEQVNGVWTDKFDWVTFFTSVQKNMPAHLYGQKVWLHVAGEKHPALDMENSLTWTYDTVRFKDKEMVLDDNGKPKPVYHKYLAAVFTTREQLVEYMLANGMEVQGASPTKSYPVPEKLMPDLVADWDECASSIVAGFANGKKPAELLGEWASTGVTLADLKAMYAIFESA